MAARRQQVYSEPIRQIPASPSRQPRRQPSAPVKVKQVPKRRFYSFKMLIILSGVGVFALAFMHLYMVSEINHVHYEIQQTQRNIRHETSINQQLNVQISELSQASRVTEVAIERGLEFLQENIVNVGR